VIRRPTATTARCPSQEVTVHLDDVSLDLTMVWDVDGTVWLVPAYTFSSADGGSYTVIAVDEQFVSLPDPGLIPEPVPADSTGSGSSGPRVLTWAADIDAAISALVGVDEAEAAKVAEGLGWTLRVVERDGEQLAVTMDFSPSRVNVAVEAGVVVSVQSFG
jgi:hypothetical protein